MNKLCFILLAVLVSLSVWGQDDIEIVSVENSYVHAYLTDDTYFYDDDYNTSVVNTYYTDTAGRLDYPAGKLVEWSRVTRIASLKGSIITVSENEELTDSMTFTTKNRGDSSFVIRNLIPYRTYYYKVEEQAYNGTLTEVARGVFRTEGQLRMIYVDGSSNVRDMGGWPTSFGVPIQYGKMYRSANFNSITVRGIHDFKENLHIGAELDLRDSTENTSSVSALGADVDFIRISTTAYHNGICYVPQALTRDLQWLIDRMREGKAVNWHCLAGSDRCGTLSFLIGGLLGMNEVDLCRDYELSRFSMRSRTRAYNTFPRMLPYIRTFGPQYDLAQCFYNYWLTRDISPEDLNFLRRTMLNIETDGFETDVPEITVNKYFEPEYYNINGTKLREPQPGLNIVRGADGHYTKVWFP